MPVRANPALTRASLYSIARHTGLPYELIIVDDRADRPTRAVLASVAGATMVVNKENLGFLESTNRGAELARGRYLVLVNNDVKVRPGWLEALVSCADEWPGAGAVAPKYVLPSGRLLEAGAIVWRDGAAWHFGSGDNPDRPQYEHRREVDYSSAAGMLVRRDAWLELGGFDRHFRPMYWEDVDFCFRLRERGWCVVYEPRSGVVHAEGSTAGRDEATGMKRFQAVNRPRFKARWAERLVEQHPHDPERARLASDRCRGPLVLVVDWDVPGAELDSGSLRMTEALLALRALGCRVVLATLSGWLREPWATRLRARGVEVLGGVGDLRSALAELGQYVTLAIVSRPEVASQAMSAVREAAPQATLAYDAVDLHFAREYGRAALGEPGAAESAEALRAEEFAAMRAADLILCVSDAEGQVVLEELPDARVEVLSNIHATSGPAPPRAGREGLVFVGSFLHPPNIDAARELVTAVMPEVWRRSGDVPLTIVGQQPPADVRKLASARVRVAGWVERIEPVLDSAVAQVAPLRYGAGVKGKITQSLACGLPVITTTVGAEGTDAVHGEHLLVADDPSEAASWVARLLEDENLWQRLSEEGQRLAADRWSTGRASRTLARILELSACRVGA